MILESNDYQESASKARSERKASNLTATWECEDSVGAWTPLNPMDLDDLLHGYRYLLVPPAREASSPFVSMVPALLCLCVSCASRCSYRLIRRDGGTDIWQSVLNCTVW